MFIFVTIVVGRPSRSTGVRDRASPPVPVTPRSSTTRNTLRVVGFRRARPGVGVTSPLARLRGFPGLARVDAASTSGPGTAEPPSALLYFLRAESVREEQPCHGACHRRATTQRRGCRGRQGGMGEPRRLCKRGLYQSVRLPKARAGGKPIQRLQHIREPAV